MMKNPADDVDAPRVHTEEVHPLTRDEARRFLKVVRGDRLEALYVVALHTGLRQGELLALRWEDVDIEEKTLIVRRTITKDGGKLLIGPTKTAKGRRTVQAHQGRRRSSQRAPDTPARRDRRPGRLLPAGRPCVRYDEGNATQPL